MMKGRIFCALSSCLFRIVPVFETVMLFMRVTYDKITQIQIYDHYSLFRGYVSERRDIQMRKDILKGVVSEARAITC